MIYRDVNVAIEPDPRELANEFCEMDADDQALVFKYIAEISQHWTEPFGFQVQEIIGSKYFCSDAGRIMRILGDYA